LDGRAWPSRFNRFNGFLLLIAAAALLILVPAAALSQEPVTNRVTFSARFSLNIRAKFQDVGNGLHISSLPRRNPDGSLYHYDDGYLLTDVSGNLGGQSWN
jgi:hypothetical protein